MRRKRSGPREATEVPPMRMPPGAYAGKSTRSERDREVLWSGTSAMDIVGDAGWREVKMKKQVELW